MGSNGKSIAQQGDWVDNKSSPWHLDARVNTQQHYGPLLNPLAARMVASTMRCLELVVWDMWRWNGWMTWISKAEWQHKRIASWMNIKTSIIIRSLYRTKVSRMSITEHWPTTICWGTTWPCLTHALRPTRSLRSRSGNILSKDYWQQILRLTAWIWVHLKQHE